MQLKIEPFFGFRGDSFIALPGSFKGDVTKVLPLIEGVVGMYFKLCRNREIRQQNIFFQVQGLNFAHHFVRIVNGRGNVGEQLRHLSGGLEIELVIVKGKTGAF
ncbi:hypothetical protein D9M68_976640 [compost metagenome]